MKKLLSSRGTAARFVNAEVVDATEQRTGKARALRDPPHVAHPAMLAVHHLSAHVVHHQGTYLNRRIDGSVPRERLKQWIQFLCASRRDGASRGPGVKSGGAVCSDSKSHPNMVFVALLVDQLAGTGSGASGRSVESETAAGRIDTTEETGVNGREISLKKVRLAGEEFVGGMSAIFSAGKPICA